MNLIFLCEVNFDVRTAERTHVIEIVKGLIKSGAVITLLVPQANNEVKELDGLGGSLKIRHYKNIKDSRLGLLINHLSAFGKLMQLPRPDVVYMRRGPLMVYNILYSFIKKVPYVLEENGIFDIEYKCYNDVEKNLASKLKFKILKWIEEINIKSSHGIIAVTEQIKKYNILQYGYKKRIQVIGNGANVKHLRPIPKDVCRKKIGISSDCIVMGYIGNLVIWQGVTYIIECIKLLRDRGSKINLLIVGNGIEYNNLVEKTRLLGLNDYITFTGSVNYSDIPTYIGATDFLIVPKNRLYTDLYDFVEYEYSPLKLSEYMACARPIISSNVKGLDIVERIGCGELCEPNSSESMANAVERIILKKGEWEEMGNKGREYIAANNSWEVVAKKTYDFLYSIAYNSYNE